MAEILQVVGALLISIAVLVIFPPAGLIVAGLFAIAFGVALERKPKSKNSKRDVNAG